MPSTPTIAQRFERTTYIALRPLLLLGRILMAAAQIGMCNVWGLFNLSLVLKARRTPRKRRAKLFFTSEAVDACTKIIKRHPRWEEARALYYRRCAARLMHAQLLPQNGEGYYHRHIRRLEHPSFGSHRPWVRRRVWGVDWDVARATFANPYHQALFVVAMLQDRAYLPTLTLHECMQALAPLPRARPAWRALARPAL